MKQLTQTQISLLQLLGDGLCHNGNELGQAIGISRSAIWKQINQLINAGISITRLPHQGYQLPDPLILLDEQVIKKSIATNGVICPINLYLFTSIDSTNRYLKELPKSTAVDLCCAEQQTQGRGRFGRHWHSPFGENIYCSSRWNLNCDLSKLSGLSLVTSLAVLTTLKELNPSPDIKVKWPNDVLWKDKKLCGILIEIIAESNGTTQIIIGIGMNVNSDTKNHPLPDKAWCSLFEISNHKSDRNLIIGSLMTHLERYLNRFIEHGFEVFINEWAASDYLSRQVVTVTQSLGSIRGIACGVNRVGQLIVEDEDGVRHHLSSGDASLHNTI